VLQRRGSAHSKGNSKCNGFDAKAQRRKTEQPQNGVMAVVVRGADSCGATISFFLKQHEASTP
jgi:hypothetical protein